MIPPCLGIFFREGTWQTFPDNLALLFNKNEVMRLMKEFKENVSKKVGL